MRRMPSLSLPTERGAITGGDTTHGKLRFAMRNVPAVANGEGGRCEARHGGGA